MRLIYLVFVFTLSVSLLYSQVENESIDSGTSHVLKPEFKGINETFSIVDYLNANLCYPEKAKECEREGTVVIQFTVLPSGNLSDFQVINSLSAQCDKAILDALAETDGLWNPGSVSGVPMPMKEEVSIVYKDEKTDMHKSAMLYATRADKAYFKGKYKRALKFYNSAIVYCPNYPPILYRRGIAKYHTGDHEGALNDFMRVEDLGSPLADRMLAELH
jgi:TonB family protein